MQNKANVKIGNMNVSIAIIKDYDKKQWTINNERYSKQTQTNPIKANFKIGKIYISLTIIKDYDKKQLTINNERYSKQSQTKPISRRTRVGGQLLCSTGSVHLILPSYYFLVVSLNWRWRAILSSSNVSKNSNSLFATYNNNIQMHLLLILCMARWFHSRLLVPGQDRLWQSYQTTASVIYGS